MKEQNLANRILPLLVSIALVIVSLAIIQDVTASSGELKQLDSAALASEKDNGAPVVDLNGPDPDYNYATTFTEGEGPKPIVASSMTISDTDSTTLKSASVTLTNRLDGDNEFLEISTENTNLTANYDPQSGTLQLIPTDTISNYQKALRSITYNNLSNSPATNDRLITFQLFDGDNYSEQTQSTVFMEAVNDSPNLDNDANFRLSDIEEDVTNPIGNRVASFIDPAETGDEDYITDPDANSLEGIAVIGVDSDNGNWQFSVDSGATWRDFSLAADTASTLLDPSARIRFLPNKNYDGAASASFRAWDQTSGNNGETGIDVTENGGTSAFSSTTGIVTIEIVAVNDPPLSDINGINPGTDLLANYVLGSGPAPVAAPQAAMKDVDNGELNLVMVTLQTRPDGAAELLRSEFVSTSINVIPYNPSSGEIRLIGPATLAEYNDVIRAIVYDNKSESPSLGNRIIEFVAHDGLDKGPKATTTLQILSSNNAPQLDENSLMRLTDVYEDDKRPPGNSVGEIIHSADPDPIQDDEGALRGFAVVKTSSASGRWQFSVDAGLTWWTIETVSEIEATLLDTDARLRFLPDPDLSGFSREITVRAWDQSAGVNGSQEVDVSQNGGSSAFSSQTTEITIDVLAVNDAPSLELTDGITAVFTEDNGPVNVTGPSLNVADVDSQLLTSAAVSISNHRTNEADFLAAFPNGSGIATSYDTASGILALTGDGTVAEYQAVLRTITFENRSDEPAEYDRIVTIIVSDVMTNSNIVSSTVMVESVNDLPLVDLNGADVPGNNVTVQFGESSWGGEAVSISKDLELQDRDDSFLTAATVALEERPDGQSEYFAVNTDGTNITAEFEQASGQLQLTGLDTLINYERVLRTVTYSNSQTRPLTVDRRARFSVLDHAGKSNIATSHIVVIPKLVMLPFITNDKTTAPQSDEPNNICQDAFPLNNNLLYKFHAEDRNDWYSFSLTNSANITVELTDYEPEEGQILVAEGQCGVLYRIGHNGNFSTSKIIQLDNLAAGNYYIWLITDNIRSVGEPYKYNLQVKVQ